MGASLALAAVPAAAHVGAESRGGGGEAAATATGAPEPSIAKVWSGAPAHDLRGGVGIGEVPPNDPVPAVRPAIRGPPSEEVFSNVVLAFRLAVSRIRTVSSCEALFERLGADGVERLSHTVYLAPWGTPAAEQCGRDVAAFTGQGDRRTVLCPEFGLLPVSDAAVVLIHEALHTAGLGEAPSDPRAPDSLAISRAVITSCGL